MADRNIKAVGLLKKHNIYHATLLRNMSSMQKRICDGNQGGTSVRSFLYSRSVTGETVGGVCEDVCCQLKQEWYS